MIKTKWLFVSFLFGGTVALLYAPKSGKLLRQDISNKTNELIEDGKKMATETWKDAKEIAGSTMVVANEFINAKVDRIVRNTEKVKDALVAGYNAYTTHDDEKNQEKIKEIQIGNMVKQNSYE